jgi:MoaA/NifB/PqqE/SkfB family radical SAM enzyme
MNNDKENFCPWLSNGLYFGPATGIEKLEIQPCCRSFHGGLLLKEIKSSDDDLYKLAQRSSSVKEQIDKMKDPNYNYKNLSETICERCLSQEKTSGKSMRTTTKTINLESGKIGLLQIAFGNFCNYKCRYCYPRYSTEWNKDAKLLKKDWHENKEFNHLTDIVMTERQTYDYEKKIIEELKKQDLSNVRDIGIFGGEPFLSRHWEQFVELLNEKANLSKIKIQINSNFSIFPKEKIINLLTKFRKVDLRASIEAKGSLAEYIRSGLVWNTFENNVKKWQEVAKHNKSIQLRVHMAHNIYSINKLLEFEEWLFDMNLHNSYVSAGVFSPEWLDPVKVLNDDQLDQCLEILKNIKYLDLNDTVIERLKYRNYQENQPQMLRTFKSYTKTLDELRSEKLQDVNPQLYEWTFGIN